MTSTLTSPAPPETSRSPALLRPPVAVGLVLVLMALCVVASLTLGARHVGLGTVLDAWQHYDRHDGDQVVVRARLPRTVLGLLVGMALGLAGAAMQGVARNPLADPGILGVNAGAALAVVVAIAVFGVGSFSGYVWFAFGGALVASVLVYAVASLGREGATPVKLALAGAALGAGLTSVMNGVLVASQDTFDRYRFWEVGSVAVHTWTTVGKLWPFLLVGAVVLLGTGRVLNGLALGDDTARALGQRVGLTRAVTAFGVVVLCGAATAAAGPIAFVGLMVPHAVRAVVGGDYRWLLPLSAGLGGVLVVLADTVGRIVLPPSEIQVGLMTAVIGAPTFMLLVRYRDRIGL